MTYQPLAKSVTSHTSHGAWRHRARLVALVAIMHTAMGCVGIGVPLLAISLGADSLDLGLLGTASTAVYTAFALLFGRLSDRVGRDALVIAAPFIYSAAALLAGFSKSWQTLVPIYVVTAIAMALLWPAYMALVAEAAPRGRLLGQIAAYNIAWCSGLIVGNSVGGVLAGKLAPLPLDAACTLAAGVGLALLVLRCKGLLHGGTISRTAPDGELPVSPARTWLFLGACWCAMFASTFGMSALRMLFPKLALDLGFAPAAIGLLFAALTAGQAVMFVLVGAAHWWRYKLGPLVAVQGLSVLAYVIVGCTRSGAAFSLAFAVIGAAGALAYTSGYYYAVNRASRRGAFAGIHESVLGAGGALGPLIGGLLAREVGPRLPYFAAAAVIAVAIALELIGRSCWREDTPA
jgi:MFS family permease